MKSYVLSIVAAAVLCGIIRNFLDDKTTAGKILNLLSAILMTITIIAPIKQFSFYDFNDYMGSIKLDGQRYAMDGNNEAQESIQRIIKSESEAYILDKAKNLDAEITVEVELNVEENVPCGVTMTGAVSPYVKEVLSSFVEDSFGIAKEKQIWK